MQTRKDQVLTLALRKMWGGHAADVGDLNVWKAEAIVLIFVTGRVGLV